MTIGSPQLVWLRRDLRLANNPALAHALAQGDPVIPVFILDEAAAGQRQLGGATRWWLGRSLQALDRSIAQCGGKLILRRGASLAVLRQLIAETGARSLAFNRRYDPPGWTLDGQITEALRADGITVEDCDANYLHDPWQLKTGQGQAFKVFTPFWRRLSDHYHGGALTTQPGHWPAPRVWPAGDAVGSFAVTDAWSNGFADHWSPGEAGAQQQLARFLSDGVEAYGDWRDRPDVIGTSRLSPHLAWGEISIHELWRRAEPEKSSGAAAFRRELGWRDFNMHIYYHYPDLPTRPWQEAFADFPFRTSPAMMRAWQQGKTGYPLIDAGMRELWQSGWMHNRVRMVVGSFLIKDQMIDWRVGENWFWDTLVDADPAQNAGNWQWVAGCGFDAAPFFRIFNPITQSAKFDPQGRYIRRWVPELARLSDKDIHQPWTVPVERLHQAGVELGKTYPRPILDHAKARQNALAAYRRISGKTGPEDDQPGLFG
jgi:deoxyribodipyrimidine photo-lyase